MIINCLDVFSAHPNILKSMILNHPEYTTPQKARIAIGTWNVNGGKHFRSIAHKHEDINDWLLDLPKFTLDSRPGKANTQIYYRPRSRGDNTSNGDKTCFVMALCRLISYLEVKGQGLKQCQRSRSKAIGRSR